MNCPFCNSDELKITKSSSPSLTGSHVFSVYCQFCFCEGPPAATPDEARKKWSERVTPKTKSDP